MTASPMSKRNQKYVKAKRINGIVAINDSVEEEIVLSEHSSERQIEKKEGNLLIAEDLQVIDDQNSPNTKHGDNYDFNSVSQGL